MLIKLAPMSRVSDYLMQKFLDWQKESGELKSVTEFGKLMGIEQGHMSHYIRGKRPPTPKHKRQIIAYFGDEAVKAFDEDPDFYVVQENWEYFTPEERREMRSKAEAKAKKNVERTPKKRRTSTAE
jgi:hypothetical protein